MEKQLIIINRMYAGKYITVGENIGHEIINLIRCDNDCNYLWLNADGNCDISKFVDKSGKCIYDKITMLMVRMYGYRQWKILGKAEIDTDVLKDYMVPKFGKESHDAQVKIIEKEKIYYGDQPINEIFDGNFFNDQLQSGEDIYFTFKAKNVFLPEPTPENVEKTVINIKNLKGLANQSLRMYLANDDEDKEETYEKFRQIVDGEIFKWESRNTTEKADPNTAVTSCEKEHFLKIINEEYRELSFSNLLAYFLKNKQIMARFAKDVLHLEDFDADSYSIAREEKNIDLFISSPRHYIVIENKIRSGLIEEETETKKISKKICEYFGQSNEKDLPPKAMDLLKVFNDNEKHYQTDRYYAYACGTVEKQKTNAKVVGYVLFPNYAEHSIDEQLKKTLFKENYKPMTYKKLQTFFAGLKDINILSETENKYLYEFLAAMDIHTREIDNLFEEEMKNRFYKKIQSANANG